MTDFNFPRWRDWLSTKTDELCAQGFAARFYSVEHDLPSCATEVESDNAAGSFRCWSNHLVDYEVFEDRAQTFVDSKSMIEVSDENFEATFESFIATFRRVN